MNALSIDDIRRAGTHVVTVSPADVQDIQLARAARLWAEGRTLADIAATLGLTPTTLRGRMRKNRTLFPARRSEQLMPDGGAPMMAAARLWAEGLASGAIAKALGLSPYKVQRWVALRRDLFDFRKPGEPAQVTRAPQALSAPAPARTEYRPGLEALVMPARVPGEPIPLVALTARTCRWPHSGTGAAMLFCGGTIRAGAVYCPEHRARAGSGRRCEEVR